jgi:hypothetical protein
MLPLIWTTVLVQRKGLALSFQWASQQNDRQTLDAVEHGLISEDDFRDFVFTDPVKLWTGLNHNFVKAQSSKTTLQRYWRNSVPVRDGERPAKGVVQVSSHAAIAASLWRLAYTRNCWFEVAAL